MHKFLYFTVACMPWCIDKGFTRRGFSEGIGKGAAGRKRRFSCTTSYQSNCRIQAIACACYPSTSSTAKTVRRQPVDSITSSYIFFLNHCFRNTGKSLLSVSCDVANVSSRNTQLALNAYMTSRSIKSRYQVIQLKLSNPQPAFNSIQFGTTTVQFMVIKHSSGLGK